jgi:hypothetical protein
LPQIYVPFTTHSSFKSVMLLRNCHLN